MARPRKRRALDAWMHDRPVGRWEQASSGEQRFRYDADWLSDPEARPVSLSLPLRGGPAYRGAVVEAWFGHLAPHRDGGRIGAVRLLPEGMPPVPDEGRIAQAPTGQAPSENEWLCSRIALAFGLPDAATLVQPHETAWQALGVSPQCKDEADAAPGAKRIMDLLLGSRAAEHDRLQFLEALVVSWMLCATNMHAGRFTLSIEPQGRFRLAAIHGYASAWPDGGASAAMAMAAIGETPVRIWGDIQPRHWLSTAQACGADPAAMRRILEQLVETTPGVVADVRARVPGERRDGIAEPILRGVERSARRLRHWLTRS